MTEEEAKTKWCPHVRLRECGQGEPAKNIYSGGSRPKCIASDCMMWKWALTYDQDNDTKFLKPLVSTEHGYCGLTG